MPAIARYDDVGSGHESWPNTNVIEGSKNTYVNSREVHCRTHEIMEHGSPSPSPIHKRYLAEGSPNTYVNSLEVGRIGDPIECGGLIFTGSPNTIVN